MHAFIFCWLPLFALAEIVLFKYDADLKELKGISLDSKEDAKIYEDVVVRYNWPSSQMYFKDQDFEREEYLKALKTDGLKEFMGSKIQDSRYRLVYVPDTLFSVAAIVAFHKSKTDPSQKPEINPLDADGNVASSLKGSNTAKVLKDIYEPLMKSDQAFKIYAAATNTLAPYLENATVNRDEALSILRGLKEEAEKVYKEPTRNGLTERQIKGLRSVYTRKAIELEMQFPSTALLWRATNGLKFDGVEVLDSFSIKCESHSKDKKENPYSVSFSSRLLDGFVYDFGQTDEGACTINYVSCSSYLYAIKIEKEKYLESLLGDQQYETALERPTASEMFLIPPLLSAAGVISKGEFFHPRSKYSLLLKDERIPTRVSGLFATDIMLSVMDYESGFRFLVVDSFPEALRLHQMSYLVENAEIIKGDKDIIASTSGYIGDLKKQVRQFLEEKTTEADRAAVSIQTELKETGQDLNAMMAGNDKPRLVGLLDRKVTEIDEAIKGLAHHSSGSLPEITKTYKRIFQARLLIRKMRELVGFLRECETDVKIAGSMFEHAVGPWFAADVVEKDVRDRLCIRGNPATIDKRGVESSIERIKSRVCEDVAVLKVYAYDQSVGEMIRREMSDYLVIVVLIESDKSQ